MKTSGTWPIGVCSWSLQQDIAGVAEAMKTLGLNHVHLDISPACRDDPDACLEQVRRQGWTISSTMIGFPQEDYSTLETIKKTGGIVPNECWEANRQRFLKAIKATAALKVPYLSSHFGFLDTTSPTYARTFYDRIRLLADAAAEHAVVLLMETGQEQAEELGDFLEMMGHPALGVNFDPANMILYNMGDPAEGVRMLAPWVRHIHIKDAVRTATAGTWGQEVVWGTGQVNARNFLNTLHEIGYNGVLSIEREAGDDRLGDIQKAVTQLTAFSANG
jgi:sugar phosphate isomerase/epimerase